MLMVFRLFDPAAAVLTAAGPPAGDPLAARMPELRTDTSDTVPPLLPGDPCMIEHCGAVFDGGEYGYTITSPSDPRRICWRHIRGLSGPVFEPDYTRRILPTGASAATIGSSTSSPAESANGADPAAPASSPATSTRSRTDTTEERPR